MKDNSLDPQTILADVEAFFANVPEPEAPSVTAENQAELWLGPRTAYIAELESSLRAHLAEHESEFYSARLLVSPAPETRDAYPSAPPPEPQLSWLEAQAIRRAYGERSSAILVTAWCLGVSSTVISAVNALLTDDLFSKFVAIAAAVCVLVLTPLTFGRVDPYVGRTFTAAEVCSPSRITFTGENRGPVQHR